MYITTERLQILPLTYSQCTDLSIGDMYEGEPPLKPEKPSFGLFQYNQDTGSLRHVCADNFLFFEKWWLLRKEDRALIGTLGFHGPANDAGEVQIGIRLGEAYQGYGYMSEAVQAMCKWALAHEEVKSVIAQTVSRNDASTRLFERCGFEKYRDGMYVVHYARRRTFWWRFPSGIDP